MFKAEELFQNITDRNHPDETVLTIIQGKGTLPREQAGRNIHYDDASLSNYKKVEQGDFIIHLRSFEGGLEMANEAGIVSPAYTILRCKRPHSSLFYDAYFHTDEFINHNLSKSVEGIRDGRQISYEAFKWLGIPYCEPTEQEKISTLFSAFNERIAKQRDLVESLKKYKRGVVRTLLSPKHCKLKNVEWTTAKIGNIGTFIKGAPLSKADISSDGTPFILYGELYTTYNEVISKVVRKTQASVDKQYYSQIGDVIIPSSGETPEEISTASCVMLPDIILAGDLNIYRCTQVDGRIMSYILNHVVNDRIARVAQGKSIVHVQATEISKIEITSPDLISQKKLIETFDAITARIDQSMRELELLQVHRKALLQQLFI